MRSLLLGCGRSREKRVWVDGKDKWEGELVTCDREWQNNPDVVCNLDSDSWPFLSDDFDEVHAYEILEHLGRQGDVRSFFSTFAECWRILKPGGLLCATVPSWRSEWAWGDPSHTRVITPGQLAFLSQREYHEQVGKTPMSDFRWLWKRDFEVEWGEENGKRFAFILRAVKPARNYPSL